MRTRRIDTRRPARVRVRVLPGNTVYRHARHWTPGEELTVSRYDLRHLRRRGMVEEIS